MLKRLMKASAPLTVTGWLMLGALAASSAGLIWDDRLIIGAPAWLKPAKFAISIAIYSFTLAAIFTLLPPWVRTRRVVGWVTAIALVLELVIIDLQAWRGTASHFNVSSALNAALWSVMGITIVIQTITSIAVAVALWRQPFADKALGWALRLGMAITIVGAFSGGLMARPTSEQIAAAETGRPIAVGAHTVGAPDGGRGLPGTGWSTEHGDLRVAHFVGLHAVQVLPLLALLLARRRWPEAVRVQLTLTAAASYAALFALLLWQALHGQSLIAPETDTLVAFGVWLVLTAAAVRAGWVSKTPVSGALTGPAAVAR